MILLSTKNKQCAVPKLSNNYNVKNSIIYVFGNIFNS